MAGFDMRATLPLTTGTFSRANLIDFLEKIPKDAPLSVETRITDPDRQGEVRVAHTAIVATWKG